MSMCGDHDADLNSVREAGLPVGYIAVGILDIGDDALPLSVLQVWEEDTRDVALCVELIGWLCCPYKYF